MRIKIIRFLKSHPKCVTFFWNLARLGLLIWGFFVPLQKKTMIFCSFGGRKFDDSPKAIYDEICRRSEFDDWKLIWAFVEPDSFSIPRGEKIKIDTIAFFRALLYSRVWISNSGMDRGIELHRKKNIIVETWHGAPLKKIGGEENQNSLGGGSTISKGKKDFSTIRCAQSEYDREIFSRVFNAEKESILLCDLPRNDALTKYTHKDIKIIKDNLGIPCNKKTILYTPTYREYLVDENNDNYIAPPIDLHKWQREIGDTYVLLIRAHYAVSAKLNIINNGFVFDVSTYPCLNDLYAISDIMISDYSSTYFDYSILKRPMLCFAYDLKEYEEKRGLYLKLEGNLPCRIDKTEDELLETIKELDYEKASKAAEWFHLKYSPFAGEASRKVVDMIIQKLG